MSDGPIVRDGYVAGGTNRYHNGAARNTYHNGAAPNTYRNNGGAARYPMGHTTTEQARRFEVGEIRVERDPIQRLGGFSTSCCFTLKLPLPTTSHPHHPWLLCL